MRVSKRSNGIDESPNGLRSRLRHSKQIYLSHVINKRSSHHKRHQSRSKTMHRMCIIQYLYFDVKTFSSYLFAGTYLSRFDINMSVQLLIALKVISGSQLTSFKFYDLTWFLRWKNKSYQYFVIMTDIFYGIVRQ